MFINFVICFFHVQSASDARGETQPTLKICCRIQQACRWIPVPVKSGALTWNLGLSMTKWHWKWQPGGKSHKHSLWVIPMWRADVCVHALGLLGPVLLSKLEWKWTPKKIICELKFKKKVYQKKSQTLICKKPFYLVKDVMPAKLSLSSSPPQCLLLPWFKKL